MAKIKEIERTPNPDRIAFFVYWDEPLTTWELHTDRFENDNRLC